MPKTGASERSPSGFRTIGTIFPKSGKVPDAFYRIQEVPHVIALSRGCEVTFAPQRLGEKSNRCVS